MSIGRFFSQRFGYAAHALGFMAHKPFGALTTLPELAAWVRSIWPQASETYLSNVVQRLVRGGVLRSHRGIAGGYSLARHPEEITLRDLAGILEGISLGHCSLSLGESCPNLKHCPIRENLGQIEEQYLDSLKKVTLLDIAAGLESNNAKKVTV